MHIGILLLARLMFNFLLFSNAPMPKIFTFQVILNIQRNKLNRGFTVFSDLGTEDRKPCLKHLWPLKYYLHIILQTIQRFFFGISEIFSLNKYNRFIVILRQ